MYWGWQWQETIICYCKIEETSQQKKTTDAQENGQRVARLQAP